MRELLELVSVPLGCAGILIALLEFFLSQKQKNALADIILRVWSALDDWKNVRWMQFLNKRGAQISAILVSSTLVGIYAAWVRNDVKMRSEDVDLTVLLIIVGISLLIGAWVIHYVFKSASLIGAVVKATVVLGAILAPIVAIIAVAVYFPNELKPEGHVTLLQMGWLIAFVFGILSGVGLLIAWAVTALPLVALACAQTALATFEFVLRRSAEYSKGPLLAFGFLIASAAGLVKIFA